MLYVSCRQISREEVDKYKPGQWIPECQLIVQWAKEDQRPVQLRHKVDLIGAIAPYNFIYFSLNPAIEGTYVEDHSTQGYTYGMCVVINFVMSHHHPIL